MKHTYIPLLMFLCLVTATGCAVKRPTIAHTHVGHALTGWHDTPDKEGLFIVAEKMARQSLDSAILATQDANSLDTVKRLTRDVVAATNPAQPAAAGKTSYGVKQALTGAIGHLTYAATSDDASDNMRQFAARFEQYAQTVIDRCDLITILGKDIQASTSRNETDLLAGEIIRLAQGNLYGEDPDEDGQRGEDPSEYGLKQLRRKIEEMLDREDPPYSTVNRWYLFNLIRLPDGSWIFRNRFEEKDSAYGNGNGGGGGGY